MGHIGLHHDLRAPRIGDIDRGEVFRGALMGKPQNAPAARQALHGNAFAYSAESAQRVLRQQPHVALLGIKSRLHRLSPYTCSPGATLSYHSRIWRPVMKRTSACPAMYSNACSRYLMR